jgi:hypothetical protein
MRKTIIAAFVKECLQDKSETVHLLEIGSISNYEAELIRYKTGLNVSGYTRIIDNYGIKHTLKQHGKAELEQLRGQLPIIPSDFELIPQIVKTENIIYSGKNKIGNDVILYEAVLDNVFYYAEEVRNKRKKLALQSIWKRKRKI